MGAAESLKARSAVLDDGAEAIRTTGVLPLTTIPRTFSVAKPLAEIAATTHSTALTWNSCLAQGSKTSCAVDSASASRG